MLRLMGGPCYPTSPWDRDGEVLRFEAYEPIVDLGGAIVFWTPRKSGLWQVTLRSWWFCDVRVFFSIEGAEAQSILFMQGFCEPIELGLHNSLRFTKVPNTRG